MTATTGQSRILVSACLLGRPVRYDGQARTLPHPALARWADEGRLVAVCPELAAGFGVPRPPAEIASAASGHDVIAGRGRVVTGGGADVTSAYLAGAGAALALARQHGCRHALLVDGSPSCGSATIHDGSFSGRRHTGVGVTTAVLEAAGIVVFAETGIDALAAAIALAEA